MKTFIQGIGIENFKTFSNYQFCNFSSLSFLIGKNGAGKSSFLQAAQLIFKFLERANSKWDEIVDNEFQIVEIDKIISDDFFDTYNDFTSISQIINDTNKPLKIDLVINLGYEKGNFIISPLKFQFIFSIQSNQNQFILFLDEFNIYDYEQNQLLFTNNVNIWNESFNIDFTKDGLRFLLNSFLKYINSEDLSVGRTKLENLMGITTINDNKNSLKTNFLPFEKQFLYEIDEVSFNSPSQSFPNPQGSVVEKIKIFNGGIVDNLITPSIELKKALNITYQAIKGTLLLTAKKIAELENVKISEISSRKRALNKDDVYLKCFPNEQKLNSEFIKNNLLRFHFKGKPFKERISPDDNKYKVILKNEGERNFNLIDEGSGYWTLTYILYVLGDEQNKNKIFFIEEPETYLHPNFQANLADLLIEAIKTFNHQIIVETHSEYLIKRLERRIKETLRKEKLTAKIIDEQEPLPFDILPQDIAINYIHDASLNNEVVRIKFDDHGDLDTHFPPDFTDVSIREELFNLNLKNLN